MTGAARVRLALLSAAFLTLASGQAAEALSGNAGLAAAGAAGWLMVALAARVGAAFDPALTAEDRAPARASVLVPALPFTGALVAAAVALAGPGQPLSPEGAAILLANSRQVAA